MAGNFGGFFKGDKRKIKKTILEKKAVRLESQQAFVLPKVEIIKKGKHEE
jgi:hypothetical protein